MSVRPSLARAFSTLTALVVGTSPLGCVAQSQMLLSKPRQRCEGHHGAGAHAHASGGSIRVVSYNIKAGKGSSLRDVYQTLERMNADVISLQEVEVRGSPGDAMGQAQWLADALGMELAFAASRKAKDDGHFGVAVLSRLPILETRRVPLDARFTWEPRVALDVKLCTGRDKPLRVIAVHSDIFGWSSRANAASLAELSRSSIGEGVVIAGDLNTTPDGDAVRSLKAAGLADVIGLHAEGVTFPGFPTARLDYLFVDGPLASAVKNVRIGTSRASDHYPVMADFDLSSLGVSAVLVSGAE